MSWQLLDRSQWVMLLNKTVLVVEVNDNQEIGTTLICPYDFYYYL